MLGIENTQIINSINNFLNRRINLLALILAIIVFFCGALFLISPKYNEVKESIKSAGQKEGAEYFERYKYYGQLEELSREYKKINNSDIEKIEIMVPKEKYQEEILAYLEEFVLRNGLLITSANIQEEAAQSDKIGNFIIALNIAGVDYSGLKKIIAEIENNLRILDIESLSFSPESESAVFNISVYYFK